MINAHYFKGFKLSEPRNFLVYKHQANLLENDLTSVGMPYTMPSIKIDVTKLIHSGLLMKVCSTSWKKLFIALKFQSCLIPANLKYSLTS